MKDSGLEGSFIININKRVKNESQVNRLKSENICPTGSNDHKTFSFANSIK